MSNEAGLYPKYTIYNQATGDEVLEAFVLRPDRDWAARDALAHYALHTPNKALADDLLAWLLRLKAQDAVNNLPFVLLKTKAHLMQVHLIDNRPGFITYQTTDGDFCVAYLQLNSEFPYYTIAHLTRSAWNALWLGELTLRQAMVTAIRVVSLHTSNRQLTVFSWSAEDWRPGRWTPETEDKLPPDNVVVDLQVDYAADLLAVSVRFYASRFGTYRLINQDGNDMSIYPPEKDDEWDMSRVGHRLARMLRRAQSEQTVWKPVGVDEDFGYIFERVKGLT